MQQNTLQHSKKMSTTANATEYAKYIPMYGVVHLSGKIKPFIEHPFFVRMQNISQLGTLKFKLPNANIYRYIHSMGVAHLAHITMQALKAKIPNISDEEAFCVELAALYHDIGHGPYSHTFDRLLAQKFERKRYEEDKETNERQNKQIDSAEILYNITLKHEYRSMKITGYICEELKTAGKSDITAEMIELVKYFIDPIKYKILYPETYAQLNFTKGIDQIVNNYECQMDVDKFDYIMRDSIALEIKPEKRFKIKKILRNTDIINGVWCFPVTYCQDLHGIIYHRFNLYTSFYENIYSVVSSLVLEHCIRAIDDCQSILNYALLNNENDYHNFAMLTDIFVEDIILNSDKQAIKNVRSNFKKISNSYRNNNNENAVLDVYKLVNGYVILKDGSKHGDKKNDITNGCEVVKISTISNSSNPLSVLSKIKYHGGGKVITNSDIKNIHFVLYPNDEETS